MQSAVAPQSLGRLLEGVRFELHPEGQVEEQEGQSRPRGGRRGGRLGGKEPSVVGGGRRSLQSAWGGLGSERAV